MWNKRNVIMLPSKTKSPIVLGDNLLINIPGVFRGTSFHLYITSDDDFNTDDWVYSIRGYVGKFGEFENSYKDECKKIIATTNSSLTIQHQTSQGNLYNEPLPQPSQSFIKEYVEAYNNSNVIIDVLVEYLRGSDGYYDKNDNWYWKILGLKVNPKDNTITIKKVKDSWSREEVESLIYFAMKDRCYTTVAEFNKWIEENL